MTSQEYRQFMDGFMKVCVYCGLQNVNPVSYLAFIALLPEYEF